TKLNPVCVRKLSYGLKFGKYFTAREQINLEANFVRMSLDMLRYFCYEWEL
ncbi:9594_t:CDS:1, partial [Cetraspora pellucida]